MSKKGPHKNSADPQQHPCVGPGPANLNWKVDEGHWRRFPEKSASMMSVKAASASNRNMRAVAKEVFLVLDSINRSTTETEGMEKRTEHEDAEAYFNAPSGIDRPARKRPPPQGVDRWHGRMPRSGQKTLNVRIRCAQGRRRRVECRGSAGSFASLGREK